MSILNYLQNKHVLSALRSAAKEFPFYREFLERAHIDARGVKTLQDFHSHVPVLSKANLFSDNLGHPRSIIRHSRLDDCNIIFPSSGYSGSFSFGLLSSHDAGRLSQKIDRVLDHFFKVSQSKTLLVNCLSMNINIPATKVTVINAGLRSDIAVSTIKTFAHEFDQVLIIGENIFIKNLIESGAEKNLPWSDIKISIIMGGETFPESFRSYLEHLLGITALSTDKGIVASSFGFAELGLNILWETPKTIALRRKLCSDDNARSALVGDSFSSCPVFFLGDPLSTYVELFNGQLLFTDLNKSSKLPIIRYATGDEGLIIPYKTLKRTLKKLELSTMLPEFKVPLIALKGRSQFFAFERLRLYPDMIKDLLYSCRDIPPYLTGYFRMKKADMTLRLEFQAKEKKALDEQKKKTLHSALTNKFGIDVDLAFFPYNQFPYGMEMDYERKFQYI